MSTLAKLASGLLNRVKVPAPEGEALGEITLPAAETTGGMGVMDALRQRHSQRLFSPDPVGPHVLSNLLWAACGINRPAEGGRTAPSAMNAQEVALYVALAQGLYLYKPHRHVLALVVEKDVRRVTGYQDFVDNAPMDLVFVADHALMGLVPASKRSRYCAISAGAMAQNVALYCCSAGLANVVRAWFDRNALAQAMELVVDQQILLTQTVGYPAAAAADAATPAAG
jgi:nitroreductase